MRSYAMRVVVPVLSATHLINLVVTRQVSALNPALRIPPTVLQACGPEKSAYLMVRYYGILLGYNSDKKCRISVFIEGDVPDELINHSVSEVIKNLQKNFKLNIFKIPLKNER
ncbi:MAG: hypothetical protein JXB00_14515 [Bacteroidales bacterium]|nr:hypothetical protein [Bacteroidales bacterium]